MSEQRVSIRGTSDGLIIELGPGDLETIRNELAQRIGQSASFFRGGRVALKVGSRVLNRDEIEAIGNMLYDWRVTLWSVESNAAETRAAADSLGLETGAAGAAPPAPPQTRETPPDVVEETRTQSTRQASEGLLVRRTLRSGASIIHRGHVVVIGDVNSGAEIVAGGDIVVWGKLRGLVHAGAGGDDEAIVCALGMLPSQLRIGTRVALTTREAKSNRSYPQIASVRDGEITFDPWTHHAPERRRQPETRFGKFFHRVFRRQRGH